MDNTNDIALLIAKKLVHHLTDEETAYLERWMAVRPENRELAATLTLEYVEKEGKEMQDIDVETGWEELMSRVELGTPVGKSKKYFWTRMAAAAAVLLVAAGIFYWVDHYRNPTDKTLSETKTTQPPVDIEPGGQKAMLTLGDGKTLILDSVQNGIIARESGSAILKSSGELVYNEEQKDPAEIVFNTVATPRGGEYKVVLPDGTRAWLNAASSIRFPTAFAGVQREVTITGEVYFEVAKNKQKPFIVSAGGTEVKVLGTHFNVNAYPDEKLIRTTLLEGAVQVTKGEQKVLLKPGQEAQVAGAVIKPVLDVDAEAAVSWRNNKFNFNNTPIQEVMRQLARWYNVEVEYEGQVEDEITGSVSRSLGANALLKGLESIGYVKFRIEGKKIIVSRKAIQ